MDTTTRSYDVIAMGRSSIDLYSNDIGAPFVDITNFAALVGGCPTNISVGTRRLGLRSALLTAVGNDPVGEFVLNFLNNEGVAPFLQQVAEGIAAGPNVRGALVGRNVLYPGDADPL